MTATADFLIALAAEQIAGYIPDWATRPLFPWEMGVDFAGIENDQETAYALTASSVDKVRDTVLDAMTNALGDGSAEQVAAELAAFGANQPKVVKDAIAAATGDIAASLGITFDRAGKGLLGDAEGQGVGHGDIDTSPDRDTRDSHRAMARTAPAWVWQRLNQTATAAGGPTAPGKDAVLAAAKATKMDGGYDLARQAVNVAHGTGRAKAAHQLPVPERVYASELLDKATCGPCAQVDGKQYTSTAEADSDYPEGGYRACSGGHRCRGTLVYVWEEEGPSDEGLLPYLRTTPPKPGLTEAEIKRAKRAEYDKARNARLRAEKEAKRKEEAELARRKAEADALAKRLRENEEARRREIAEKTEAARKKHEAEQLARVIAEREARAEKERLAKIKADVARKTAPRAKKAAPVLPTDVEQPITAWLDENLNAPWSEQLAVIQARAKFGKKWYGTNDEYTKDRPAQLRREIVGIGEAIEKEARARALKTRPVGVRPHHSDDGWKLHLGKTRREVLAEIRPMGGDVPIRGVQSPQLMSEGAKAVKEAYHFYPTDWLKRAAKGMGSIEVSQVARGFFSVQRRLIALSGSGQSRKNTAIHEVGHLMEEFGATGRLRRAEAKFHEYRTTRGGKRDRTELIYGKSHPTESGRPDEYALRYSGKEYGGRYFEVLTTCAESIFGTSRHTTKMGKDDEEMQNWLLGVMATL